MECDGYEADLPLWEELADTTDGPILDLGCGTGRVALHLARRGHAVSGLEIDPLLVAAFAERAAKLPATAIAGDARDFDLAAEFGLALAPMQLIQLFGDSAQRRRCLACIGQHLQPGGLAALAIVEGIPQPVNTARPLPDTREVDGWVYSSLPIEARVDSVELRARRLRQTVSPRGELSEELSEDVLRVVDASTLAEEAKPAGLKPVGRRHIPPTADHVGSAVLLLEKEA